MNSLLKTADRLYALFLRIANGLQTPLLLVVRLYWGWQFFTAGWGKITNIQKPIDYFQQLGIPAPVLNAYFVSALEVAGGVLLIVGLGSRLIALPLAIDMLAAFWFAEREALGSIFSDSDKFLAAAPLTFLVASLVVLAFGPGWLSLDTLASRWFEKRKTSQ